jgi:hypothetical protein
MFDSGITVTVIRQSRDIHGDKTVVSTHAIEFCAFAPTNGTVGGSQELTDRRATVITDNQIYAPPGADITPADKVRLPDGTTWQVDGAPAPWTNPWTGEPMGIVVPIKRVTG